MRLFSIRSKLSLIFWYALAAAGALTVGLWFGPPGYAAFGVIGFVWPAWFLSAAWILLGELRHKGYDWLTYGKAIKLVINHGARAWRLPPRGEAAAAPGYADNWEGLERFLRQAHDLPAVMPKPVEPLQNWIEEHGHLPDRVPKTRLERMVSSPWTFWLSMIALNAVCTLIVIREPRAGGVFGFNGALWPVWILCCVPLWRNYLVRAGYEKPSFRAAWGIVALNSTSWRLPTREELRRICGEVYRDDPDFLRDTAFTLGTAVKRMKKRPAA